jgi:hypothetical protein
MKYSRKKVKMDLVPVVWVLVAICLVLGILLGYLLLKQNNAVDSPTLSDTVPPDADQPEVLTDTGDGWLELQTPYGALRYPDDWHDYLRVYASKDLGYTVQFSCRLSAGVELPMFDISFVEIKGNLIGYVAADGSVPVPVYLQTYSLLNEDVLRDGSWDTYLAMQEELNQVLEQITFTDVPEEPEDVVIATPYGELTYPGEYRQYLKTQRKENGAEYTVEFYCVFGSDEAWKLFTVTFNDNPEGAAHTMKDNGKMVHISMEEPSLDGLSQQKQNMLLSMMEAVNDLLDALDC